MHKVGNYSRWFDSLFFMTNHHYHFLQITLSQRIYISSVSVDLYGKLNLRQVDLAITSERSENCMGYDNFTAFTHTHTHSEYAKSRRRV